MNTNTKAIKLKIDHYCESNGLSIKDFADKLNMTRQSLHNMLSGQQNFTATFFLGIMNNTDIDIYKLFDENPNNVMVVREENEEYGDTRGAKKYKKALTDIKEILEKTQI